jgi:oligopeptide/dipeptide ABC transporter ATP-binding protein
MNEILSIDGVHKRFALAAHGSIYALNGVTLGLEEGKTVGLIGESGSGKSTLGRVALGLMAPDAGTVRFQGVSLASMSGREAAAVRSKVQAVFQEPYESLNPRMSVGAIVAEPLVINQRTWTRLERRRRVNEVLEEVGLERDLAFRRPKALSGGQQQRVGIARAIVNRPACIILDEPTSSLDLSVRAQITALLAQLQRDHGMTYLLITHDVSTVSQLSDELAVMYLGRIVETGPTDRVLADPRHPYTQALLSARLSPNPHEEGEHVALQGDPPTPTSLLDQCPLCGRCPLELPACREAVPALAVVRPDHRAACIRAGEMVTLRDAGLVTLPHAEGAS